MSKVEEKSATKQPPQKEKTQAQKGEDGSHFFELDNKKRVTVRKFKGKTYVDIREYYEKDGKMLPGNKGVSLNVESWTRLQELMEDIEQSIAETI